MNKTLVIFLITKIKIRIYSAKKSDKKYTISCLFGKKHTTLYNLTYTLH